MPQHAHDPHANFRFTIGYRMAGQSDAWRPALEVYETEKALVVRAELAGIDEKHLRVALDGDLLTIEGQRLPDARGETDTPERRSYHEMGIPYGPFRARVALPFTVMRDGVEADYEHGVLTIVLPRAERIRIHAKRAAEPVAIGAAENETTSEDMGKDTQ